MITKELLDYIIYQLGHGQSWEKIESDLLGNGWTPDVLSEAKESVAAEHPEFGLKPIIQSPIIQETPSTQEVPSTLDDVVIVGVNPEEKTRAMDVSVDDIVFKPQSNPENPNPAISTNPPADALTMSPSVGNVSVETKPENINDKYKIDPNEPEPDVSGPISITVNKVDPDPKSPIKAKEPITSQKQSDVLLNPKNTKPEEVKKEKKKSAFPVWLAILLFFFLIIAGGSAFAYFNYLSPEKMAVRVIAQSKELKAAEFSNNIKVDINRLPDDIKGPVKGSLSSLQAAGISMDQVLDNQLKADMVISGKFDSKDPADYLIDTLSSINYTDNMGNKYAFSLGEKLYGNSLYVKPESISIPDMSKVTPEMQGAIGKWVRMMKSDEAPKTISAYITEVIGYYERVSSNENFLKAVSFENKGIETLDNNYCFRTELSYDKQKMKELILTEMKNAGADTASFNENYDSIYDDIISKVKVTMWVGILDANIYKVSLEYSNISKWGDISLSVESDINKHNSLITVDSPDSFMDLEELLTSLMLGGQTKTGLEDNQIRDSIAQARTIALDYNRANKGYKGLDTYEAMKRVVEQDMNTWGGDPAVLLVSDNSYCLSKKLVNSSDSWCVDSSDFVGAGVCDNSGIKCIGVGNPGAVTPVEIPTDSKPVVDPEDVNRAKKEYMNQLKESLDNQKAVKGTYLGFVSSKAGIELVKNINEGEKESVVIATSSAKYCSMMKFDNGASYCVDSAGFKGVGTGCSDKTFVCTPVEE
jgi:hypothetical protein